MSRTPEEAQAKLDECRRAIDEIDVQLTTLLNDRARVVEVIGQVKQELAIKVYEPKREDQVMSNVSANNHGPLGNDALRRIYERIMDEMRTLQRDRMASSEANKGEASS